MYLGTNKMNIKEYRNSENYTKLKIGFILLFLLFMMLIKCILPNNIVFAESRIGVTASKEMVEKEEIIEITVDTINPTISAFTLQIYFDTTRLEYAGETDNSNFVGNRVIYTWIDTDLKTRTDTKKEKFKFKALQDGEANIVVTGEFYDKNGNQIDLQDGAIQVIIGKEAGVQNVITSDDNKNSQEQVSSDNTNLKIMRLNHEGISPDFQKGIKEYYFIADTSINSLEVTAIPENKDATVTITGNTNLKQGLNTIKIEVESADKTKQSVYTIYVTKTPTPELANSNLENLAVREAMLYPAFDSNITQYDIEVANDIDKVYVLAIPEKMGASVTIEGNGALKIGDNIITINVAAEDGITNKKYVIKAHRRSEEEEAKVKEEQANQVEQLEALLENQTEENKDIEKNEENKTKMDMIDVITWCLLAAVIIGFLVSFIISKVKK